jgi:hypothetical protein
LNNVVDMMVKYAGLTSDSVVVDVGAGVGKVNLHLAAVPACWSVGIEYLPDRYYLSLANQMAIFNAEESGEFLPRRNCAFVHANGESLSSLDPFGIVYMFDIGMPPEFLLHLADCLRNSLAPKFVVSYHSPEVMLAGGYGFDMEYVEDSKTTCTMHGSGEGKTARLYRCTHARPAASGTQVAAFIGGQAVPCDPVFQTALGVLEAGTAKEHTDELLAAWKNEGAGARASSSTSRWTSAGKGAAEEGAEVQAPKRGWAFEPHDFTRNRPPKTSTPSGLRTKGKALKTSDPGALEKSLKGAMPAADWAAFVAHMRS